MTINTATASAYASSMLDGKMSAQNIDMNGMDNASTQIIMEAESIRLAEANIQLKQITKTLSNGLASITKWYVNPRKVKHHKHKKISSEETIKKWRETLSQVDKLAVLDFNATRQTTFVIIPQNEDDEGDFLEKIAFAKDEPLQTTDTGATSYTANIK